MSHALSDPSKMRAPDTTEYVVAAVPPSYAIQERAVSENPDAGPQGAGWKEEEAFTLEARPHAQMVAAPLTKGSATGEGVNAPGRRQEDDVNIVAFNLRGREDGAQAELDDVASIRASEGGSSRSYIAGAIHSHATAARPDSLDASLGPDIVAFDWQAGAPQSDNDQSGGKGRKWIARAGDYAGAIGKDRRDAVGGSEVGVRRLTPIECERLQGLPDGWTQLGDTSDSRRYSALGDAVTATVSEWIGARFA